MADSLVTVQTHLGPLTTKIQDSDTVESFLEELRDSLNKKAGRPISNSWHYLLYKSKILSKESKLRDVVKHSSDSLLYVHPTSVQYDLKKPSTGLPSPAASPLSSSAAKLAASAKRPQTPTSIPITISRSGSPASSMASSLSSANSSSSSSAPMPASPSANVANSNSTSASPADPTKTNRRSSVTIVPVLPPRGYFTQTDLEGLEGMGFSEVRAKQALLIHEGNFELALDWLLALSDPADDASLSRTDQTTLEDAMRRYKNTVHH